MKPTIATLTSCRQPAALNGAHLAHSPLPARENNNRIQKNARGQKEKKTITIVGGWVSGWRQVGVWREGGREVVGKVREGKAPPIDNTIKRGSCQINFASLELTIAFLKMCC